MADYGSTDRVRRSAAEYYIVPARQRGQELIEIHSGSFEKLLVERSVLKPNRFPIICNALRSKKFSAENNLTLQEIKGPAASRQSSTVTFVFKIEPVAMQSQPSHRLPSESENSFMSLRGILSSTYSKLGGAEAFHRRESESWDQ